jgi:hypothetical protein
VRCKPQANATGPSAAPKAVIASNSGISARRTLASRALPRKDSKPTKAYAPALRERRAQAKQSGCQQSQQAALQRGGGRMSKPHVISIASDFKALYGLFNFKSHSVGLSTQSHHRHAFGAFGYFETSLGF